MTVRRYIALRNVQKVSVISHYTELKAFPLAETAACRLPLKVSKSIFPISFGRYNFRRHVEANIPAESVSLSSTRI